MSTGAWLQLAVFLALLLALAWPVVTLLVIFSVESPLAAQPTMPSPCWLFARHLFSCS